MAAAKHARLMGARVSVLDAASQTGGQFYRHLPEKAGYRSPARHEAKLHHGWHDYTQARDALLADPSCEVVTDAHVWAVEESATGGPLVQVVSGEVDGTERRTVTYRPDALVLATGAHDRTLPFPGWQLPGVYTAGAAQALAKGERLAVGHRVVVAGAGPFLLPVAQTLQLTGAQVVGVYEAGGLSALTASWLAAPWRYWQVRGKLTELGGYLGTHLRHRIPYQSGRAVVAAHGDDQVEAVTVARLDRDWSPVPGTARTVEADAVCVSHGFTPRLELAVAMGCEIATPPAGRNFRHVRVDRRQRTSAPGVWAAGEITGVGGADLSATEGAVAGHCAAGGQLDDADLAGVLRRREAYRDFAARMHAAHAIGPGWHRWLTPQTLVCRCEEVSYGRFSDAVRDTGTTGLRSLRLSSRAGLGICQGRVCGRSVEELFEQLGATPGTGDVPNDASSDRRPVATPVRLGELAQVTDTAAPSNRKAHD